jgi:NADP-dependent 3-hydroxy acid dehydrogenase YdfG
MKKVLITGVSTGFGNYYTHYLLGKGYFVIGTVRSQKYFNDEALLSNKNFMLKELDLESIESINNLINNLNDIKIDVLINNAGSSLLGNLIEIKEEKIVSYLNTYLVNTILFTKKLLPKIIETSGIIINISSLIGSNNLKGFGLYSMVKASLNMLTDSINNDFHNLAIKSVTISPGAFETNFVNNLVKISDYEKSHSTEKLLTSLVNDSRESNFQLMGNALDKALDLDFKGTNIFVGKQSNFMKEKKLDSINEIIIIK